MTARWRSILLTLAIAPVLGPVAGADEAVDGESFVVVKAGRVITVAGRAFAPGDIVIVDGKIRLVGTRLEYPPSARVIDARHETVMPGFIAPHSRYELPSYSRSGVHGNLSVADEVYLSRIAFEDFLRAGYTAVCFYPTGTGITGTSCVYRTGGPDEHRRIGEASYLRITMTSPARDKKVLRGALAKAKSEIEKVAKSREAWEKKQKSKPSSKPGGKGAATRPADDKAKPTATQPAEPEAFKPPEIDPAHRPLVDLIEAKPVTPALIELRRASDLLHLDQVLEPYEDFAHHYQLSVGTSSDFHYVLDELGGRKARVVVSPRIINLPLTVERYNLAAALARAGCEMSFTPRYDRREDLVDVRRHLADLVRAGLEVDVALAGLTLHPARIIGREQRLGSIEKGKDGDLVFLDGDPLDPHGRVTRVMILGEIVWSAEDSAR